MHYILKLKEIPVHCQIFAAPLSPLIPHQLLTKSHQRRHLIWSASPDLECFSSSSIRKKQISISSSISNVIFAIIHKHSALFRHCSQTPVLCFPEMWSLSKKIFSFLFVLLQVTTAHNLDLLDELDYDLSSARILSNEVMNGNSSLLLGLQTTLTGVYDYIG